MVFLLVLAWFLGIWAGKVVGIDGIWFRGWIPNS